MRTTKVASRRGAGMRPRDHRSIVWSRSPGGDIQRCHAYANKVVNRFFLKQMK